MKCFFTYVLLLTNLKYKVASTIEELCDNLYCEDEGGGAVCGARGEERGLRLKLFENQCQLLKFGCNVKDETAYGIINMEYCQKGLNTSSSGSKSEGTFVENPITPDRLCIDYDCSSPTDSSEVCAMREDGGGFRVRRFKNKCSLIKFNCKHDLNFTITDDSFCRGVDVYEDTDPIVKIPHKPVFVVDANMFNFNKNVNETIENFFAATHLLNLPVVNAQKSMNVSSRRMLIHIFGPQVVFKPWITIPKNISEDYYHTPTLSSCFHKCPTKCPDTYAPVCGVPGIVAREPSLMFQNHCFMDVAQCKMHWEDKSPTAESSYYIESSFVFCVGDQMSGMFRFLPVIRTLQHMGRLRKKGYFRYKLYNMRFLNNLLPREPNLMG